MGLSPDQLKRMQPHIWSEIRAYRTAIKEFAGLKKRAGPEVDLMDRRNRALEATLLHFRILRDFFYKGHGQPTDDVFAIHYSASWKAEASEVIEATKQDIDKRLAHLTTERLVHRNWDELDEINRVMEANIEKFLRLVVNGSADGVGQPYTQVLGVANNSTASITRFSSFGDFEP